MIVNERALIISFVIIHQQTIWSCNHKSTHTTEIVHDCKSMNLSCNCKLTSLNNISNEHKATELKEESSRYTSIK